MRHTYYIVILLVIYASNHVMAAGWTDRVSIGGFASANYSRTNEKLPFNGEKNIGHDEIGSWTDSRAGLTINAKINKRVRFAGQFIASEKHGYDLSIDWAFADLSLLENLNIRAGKIKFPVGLVNEYVSVGYAMPWIKAPVVIYSDLGPPNGPQITREGYTGGSLLGAVDVEDWSLDADLFAGSVGLEGAKVRKLGGLSLSADWDDILLLKVSGYQGTMYGTENDAMEGAKHRGLLFGLKADWYNFILYAEHAQITMGDLDAMKATSWYTTLGYQFNKLMPHLTYQSFNQGDGEDKQSIIALGLRWDWLSGIALKAEVSQIKTDSGVGLFPQDSAPNKTVNMISFGIDTVF